MLISALVTMPATWGNPTCLQDRPSQVNNSRRDLPEKPPEEKQMRMGLFAFAAASAFLGAALYINLVEQPARLQLDVRSMIQEWTRSNRRGFVLLSTFAITSAILGYVQFTQSGDVRWLIGEAIILATLPYVYFVVVPVNVELWALPPDAPGAPVRNLLREWGLLEWGQTAIGLLSWGILAWALLLPA
jgi:hypothetical protein